jgi:hypothetical protein
VLCCGGVGVDGAFRNNASPNPCPCSLKVLLASTKFFGVQAIGFASTYRCVFVGGEDGLLLECGGLDCCWSAEHIGDPVTSRVVLALDLSLKRLRGLLQQMFLIGLDPALRGYWLSRTAITS